MDATIKRWSGSFVNHKLNNEVDNFPSWLNCLHNSARFGSNFICQLADKNRKHWKSPALVLMMEMLSATLLFPLGLLLVLMLASMRYVPEDTVLTVHRFGRYVRTLTPGLRFTVPVMDKVVHRVRLVGHQVEVPVDGVTPAHAYVYYQILEPERTGDALEHVDALVQRRATQALSALAGAEANADSHHLATRLKQDLNHDLAVFGLRVTRCNLRDDAAV